METKEALWLTYTDTMKPSVLPETNVKSSTVVTEFQPMEELIHWKIKNFKNSMKVNYQKLNISSFTKL